MKITISVGNSHRDIHWNRQTMELEELRDRLAVTKRTAETMAQYWSFSKERRDSIKEVGGFVLGKLKNGRRKKENVESRTGIALDMDYAEPDIFDRLGTLVHNQCYVYTTHKHTPEHPRLRLIFPMSREVTAEEYVVIARKVADEIGIEQFDPTTYEVHRLMYWPSTNSDGEFIFREIVGDLLNPDAVLAKYKDWRDASEWPVSNREHEVVKREKAKQEDPLTKRGAIGAFCRTYTMTEAIEKFLGDVYAEDDTGSRYTYINGSTSGGLVVYDDKFAYSHNATDPASGKLCNAFDLVRLHKFGQLDAKRPEDTATTELPSFKAMLDFAIADPDVKALIARERREEAEEDFRDDDPEWEKKLELDRSGGVKNILENLELILKNDPNLKALVFNELADGMEIKGKVPWRHPMRFWRDADDAQLISYVNSRYGSFSQRLFDIAVTKVTDDRAYHPIREYFESLPEWDGKERVETLLIDYLGAADTAYVHAVTRKILCAAVARIMQPGIKFDNILVLNGAQGIGKSTLIARLGGEWYTDSLSISDMNDKTAAEKLQGYWIVEIGELAGMRKADLDKVKAFISRQDDKYRASFGHRVTPHPRQCVIFGTTNSEKGYLRDVTGNRRFWTVKTPGGVDRHPWDLDDDTVKQVWAEAIVYVRQGEKLYLDANLEREVQMEQRDAMEQDDREGLVRAYLEILLPEDWDTLNAFERREFIRNPNGTFVASRVGTVRRMKVSNIEIWNECFCRNKEDLRPSDSYAISAIMERIDGWEKTGGYSNSTAYGKQRVYARVEQS